MPDHKPWPFVVNLEPTPENGLDKKRHLNLKQMRAVDASRLGRKQGMVEVLYVPSIERALALLLEF